MIDEDRFETPSKDTKSIDLILAPIRGTSSVEPFGASRIDTKYSIEEFYNAILSAMMTDFYIARVDWLVNEGLW